MQNRILSNFQAAIITMMIALVPANPALADLSPSPAVVRASDDFTRVSEIAGPWVVNISTSQVVRRQYNPFWEGFFNRGITPGHTRTYRRNSLGSGIVLTADGQILTNAHVIADADEITVVLQNGQEYTAEILGEDKNVDLAVLKITSKTKLIPAELGDSDQVKVGSWAVAIGNPFGLDHTVTVGVISAKGRSNIFNGEGSSKYQNFIQTDASINPGNSGGALCDIHGKVIGINTAIYGKEGNIGIGFAIPINMVKRAAPDLVKRGRVIPPRLGFYTQDLTPQLVKALKLEDDKGVLLTDVAAGGPADKAGLQRGDVLTVINGNNIRSSLQLKSKLYEINPGEEVVLTVIRKGKKIGLRMTGEDPIAGDQGYWHGLLVTPNSKEYGTSHGLKTSQGMVITHVQPGSSAHQIGLEPLDVIVEINQKRINTTKLWKSVTRNLAESEDAVLLLIRDTSAAYIVLPGEEGN